MAVNKSLIFFSVVEYGFIFTYFVACWFTFHPTMIVLIYLPMMSTLQTFWFETIFFQCLKLSVFAIAFPNLLIYYPYNLMNVVYPLSVFFVDVMFWAFWFCYETKKIDYPSYPSYIKKNCEGEQCSICHEALENTECRDFPCKHSHHSKCIDSWLEINRSCPLCRITV